MIKLYYVIHLAITIIEHILTDSYGMFLCAYNLK